MLELWLLKSGVNNSREATGVSAEFRHGLKDYGCNFYMITQALRPSKEPGGNTTNMNAIKCSTGPDNLVHLLS